MGDKTKRSCCLLTVVFFWAFFLFIISISFFIISATSPNSKPHRVMLLGDLNSQKHKHTIYTFSSCRQAHQHRRFWVNWFSLVELFSAPSPLQPPAGSCHMVRQPQAREEHLPQAEHRGGQALPCPGASEREKQREVERGPTRSSFDQRMRGRRAGRWRLEAQQRGRGCYSLGGAGTGVEVGAGATSSVLSQFSCARGPGPGVGPGAGVGVWVGPGVGAEAGPGRWGLFMC